MVYANDESLASYLRKNFSVLRWQAKLQILSDVSEELVNLHKADYVHADLHSGNIMLGQRSYIAGPGLSRKKVESLLAGDNEIYGIMPYVAPEVLLGRQNYTQSADIYGFGVIMTEMSSGLRPFDGYEFNVDLALNICEGMRPDFDSGTPKCYFELALKCMDSEPEKRPSAYNINKTICDWLINVEIKKQFLNADKFIKSLPISKHPDEMYSD